MIFSGARSIRFAQSAFGNGPEERVRSRRDRLLVSGHQFAVYQQDGNSIPSPGIIPIAKIDAGTEAFNVSGSVKVTIELAK
jgi:hypothetical protein